MQTAARELFYVDAPVGLAVQSTQDTVIVKGFVSVQTKDRAGDTASAYAFDVERFMAAPTLFVNHKPWTDDRGNSVSVGRPMELYPAKLVPIEGDADNWGVYNLVKKEVTNTYPKIKVPALRAGDRGLFTVAEINQPEVARMVLRGELSAFSWRGLATVDFKVNSAGQTVREFTDVDMYEYSLVNMPMNPDSTFVIGRDVDGSVVPDEALSKEPLIVHAVSLSVHTFAQKEAAVEYLKAHGLNSDVVSEKETYRLFPQRRDDLIDITKLMKVKMVEGVEFIVGPPKKNPSRVTWVGETVSADVLILPDQQADTQKGVGMSTTATQPATQAGNDGKVTEEAAKTVETAKMTEDQSKAAEAFAAIMGKQTAELVTASLKDTIEKMVGGMTDLTTSIKALLEKSAGTSTETETNTEKTAPAATAEVAKSVVSLDDTSKDLINKFLRSVPATMTREEVVKSADSEDPNACFDSMFAFHKAK